MEFYFWFYFQHCVDFFILEHSFFNLKLVFLFEIKKFNEFPLKKFQPFSAINSREKFTIIDESILNGFKMIILFQWELNINERLEVI